MDARDRESSQSRQAVKRPWEDAMGVSGGVWHGTLIPPIDALVPVARGEGSEGIPSSHYGGDPWESVAKKARYEGSGYSMFPRDAPDLMDHRYNHNRGAAESLSVPAKQRGDTWGSADSQDPGRVCWRCRRELSRYTEIEFTESCENCNRSPELASATQFVAAGLTRLTETLRTGQSSRRRGHINYRVSTEDHDAPKNAGPADCPPIAQFGMKQVLSWMIGRINHLNQLADRLVEQLPPATLENLLNDSRSNDTATPDNATDVTARRVGEDSTKALRNTADGIDPTSDKNLHKTRRRLPEERPPVRLQCPLQPASSPLEGPDPRGSMMNPPPSRQLPSPPGRPLPSPTAQNFPSPSAPVNLPPSSSLHQSPSGNFLPPIASGHLSDTALQAHAAALQHEVSIQKIAFSSLQGEHDKLLAAYSRSQTRASALEKKHAVSDAEIISLTEEKLRLQNQVAEAERDIEHLSRSRDECRQSAVQEGAQYVEIVKKATQLEEISGEERRGWIRKQADLEQKIEELYAASSRQEGIPSTETVTPAMRILDDVDTPATSVDLSTDLKFEPASDARTTGPTSFPSGPDREPVEYLREETRRLRGRCAELENALREIREDSHSMEAIVQAISQAGRSIRERADAQVGAEAAAAVDE